MKRRKWKPYDHQVSIANKAMDIICKTSYRVTKAINILSRLLLSIFNVRIMNGDFWKEALNNQMLIAQVLS